MKNNSVEDIIKKILFIFTIICLILFAAYLIATPKRMANDLLEVAESYGLKDVNVSINGKDSEYDVYYTTLTCSNFNDLSYSSMINLDNALSCAALDKDFTCLISYICNDDGYRIDSSCQIIKRNGKEIYNNYHNTSKYLNSDEYKKKLEEEEAAISKPFTGSYKSHGSSSKKNDDDYDPYHAKDYSYEEDFYDDYYDEFYDYEDAVDYYYAHQK